MLALVRSKSGAISLLILALLTALGFVMLPQGTTPARANAGTILRTLNAAQPACNPSTSSPSVGVGFDGTDLLVTCSTSNVIVRVSPADGSLLGTMTVDGITPAEGIGAISWDAEHNLLWAGTALVVPQKIYSIVLDKPSGIAVASYLFSHSLGGWSIIDGIAYDGFDDTIWLSPDISGVVYHYGLQGGALIGSLDVTSSLGGFGNSGLAVADAASLYLGNNGGGQIYTAAKSGTAAKKNQPAVSFFASLSGKRVEDMECDNVTFASKSALWSKDAYDSELNAFEVPAGQCAQGGIAEPPAPTTGQRMTGGGSFFTTTGVRVTHGFELHCASGKSPNNLEVNWSGGNNFHLEKLVSSTCSDDPTIAPTPPSAGFDTFAGKGTGRYNGAAHATAEWTFTDAGEPGANDVATIVVKDAANNVVLTASGKLERGNHQAHK